MSDVIIITLWTVVRGRGRERDGVIEREHAAPGEGQKGNVIMCLMRYMYNIYHSFLPSFFFLLCATVLFILNKKKKVYNNKLTTKNINLGVRCRLCVCGVCYITIIIIIWETARF